MKAGIRSALALFLMLLAPLPWVAVQAAAPPARTSIEYLVRYSGRMNAEATMQAQLEYDGRQYSLVEESRGKGLAAVLMPGVLRRSALGRIGAEGLRPAEFRDRRGNRPEQLATFDWERSTVVFTSDGKSESQAVGEPGLLLDRLSFLWTFAFRSGAALQAGTQVRAWLADGRGLSLFTYQVTKEEALSTPAGTFRTIKLEKRVEPGDARTTEIWLALDRGMLPVRLLVVEKDGTRTDQLATRIGS
jgi:hypothetical protein